MPRVVSWMNLRIKRAKRMTMIGMESRPPQKFVSLCLCLLVRLGSLSKMFNLDMIYVHI